MTFTNLRCFIETARCENFTQAAHNLFMSQPAVSKQVAQVEAEAGVPLFERAGRGVRLTASGRALYEQLKDVPDLTDRAFEKARALGRGYSGRLLVGILEGQDISAAIQPRLHAFAAANPGLDVHLERNSFSNLRAGLANGHYDLVVTLSFELEDMGAVQHRVVHSQEGAFAINRANPKAAIQALTLDMLADEPFLSISPEESPNGYALLLKQCRLHGFEPRIVRQLNSLESLILGVEAGMGVAMLDASTRLAKNSEVRIVPVAGSDHSDVCAVWPAAGALPAVARLAQGLAEPT